MEHFKAFSRNDAFATVLSTFITNISIGSNIPATTADYLASTILVALLKKNDEEIHALRELMGPNFILHIRPLAMACVFVELACNFVLAVIKDDFAEVAELC